MLDLIKSLISKPLPDPVPGQIYRIRKDENPFHQGTTIQIVDVKGKYVQYRFIHDGVPSIGLWSDKIEYFHWAYELNR